MQQQPGINGFSAAMGFNPAQNYMGQPMSAPSGPYTGMSNPYGTPTMDPSSPYGSMTSPMNPGYTGAPPGMLSPTNALSSDIKDAMRSFRDSLAFSFQTLNLTLSTLNQTVSTVGTKLGRMTPDTNDLSRNQYVNVGMRGVYLGAVSPAMANYVGNNSFGSIFSHYSPYNINPLEFYPERAKELGSRSGVMTLAAGGGLVEELANYGASMWAGKKILGALGIGASGMFGEMGAWMLGSPFGVAASAALSYLTDPIIEYGARHNRDVASMRRMSPRMGPGFDIFQSQRAVGGIERLALRDTLLTNSLQPRMGLQGFMEMTMMGLQGNMFQGASADDLLKQVNSASHIVKFLMGVLGSKDVRDAMTSIKQLKDMGVNVFQTRDYARSLGMDAFGYGRAMGVDSNSLLNAAANMSMAAYGQYGNPAFIGIRTGMRNLAYMQELEKRGAISAADLAAGGGAQNMGARMLEFQAAMQNSWHVGMPMLYAGWDGKTGFDQSKFKQAFKSGDFFGAIGAAANNMFSGSINDLTHALMNKNNILADAANTVDENGRPVLDKNMKDMLLARIMLTPGMQDYTSSMDKRISTAGYALMQIGKAELGIDLDPATAKAMARDLLQPSYGNRVEQMRMMQENKGRFEYVSASRGIGRFTESISEEIEKIKARAHEGLIASIARPVTDFASAKYEYLHGNPWIENNIKFSSNNLESYKWATEVAKDGTKYAPTYSSDDLAIAFDRLNDADSLGHLWSRATKTRLNSLEDMLAYNDHVDTYSLYESMASSDKMTGNEFAIKYADSLGALTLKDLRERNRPSYYKGKDKHGEYSQKYLNDLANGDNSHAPLYIAGAALRDVDTPATRANRARLENLYNERFAGAGSILSDYGQQRLFTKGTNTVNSDITANDILAKILNGNWKNYLNEDFSKRLEGLSENERMYVLAREVQKIANKDSFRDSKGSYVEALANGVDYSMLRDYAVTFGNARNAFQKLEFKDARKLDLSRLRQMDIFLESGVSATEMAELFSASSRDELSNLANSLGELATYTGDYDMMDNATRKSIFANQSDRGKKILAKMMDEFKNGQSFRNKIASKSNQSFDNMGTSETRNLATDIMKSYLGSIGVHLNSSQAYNILKNAGLSDITIDNSMSKFETLPQLLANLNDDAIKDNPHLQIGKRSANTLLGMSAAELEKYAGLKSGTITEANRAEYVRNIILNDIGAYQQVDKKTSDEVRLKKETAVDSTVGDSVEGPALRVITVNKLEQLRYDIDNKTHKSPNFSNYAGELPPQAGRFYNSSPSYTEGN